MSVFPKAVVAVALEETDRTLLEYARMLHNAGIIEEWHCVHIASSNELPGVPSFFENYPTPVMFTGAREDGLLQFLTSSCADVVLLGHKRQRRVFRSLARRTAMQAPCSVWMVPESSPVELRNILAPIDCSQRCADSLTIAASIAGAANLESLTALHVYFDSSVLADEESAPHTRLREEEQLNLFLARVPLGEAAAQLVLEESPHTARTILTTALRIHAGLVVMSTRGRSMSAAVLLGSVTEQVMMESTLPVLAVKHFGRRMGVLGVLREERFHQKEDVRFG